MLLHTTFFLEAPLESIILGKDDNNATVGNANIKGEQEVANAGNNGYGNEQEDGEERTVSGQGCQMEDLNKKILHMYMARFANRRVANMQSLNTVPEHSKKQIRRWHCKLFDQLIN